MKIDRATRCPLSYEAGMTLIELMIAAAVGLGVIGAALSMLVMSQKATTVNEQVVETQQNVRVAMEMLARDMRLASYNYVGNVPGAPTVGTCSVTNGAFSRPVGLRPRDQNPTGADTGPDSISMVVPLLTDVVTPWVLSANVGGTGIDPVPFNALPIAAAVITDMVSQGLVAGSVVSIGGSVVRAVGTVSATSLTLSSSIDGKFPAGTPVYLLQCVTYAVGTTTAICGTGSTACLTRNGVPLVDGIEDLQFSYGCDGCSTAAPNPLSPDGVLDEIDGVNTTSVPSINDFVTNSAWNVPPMSPEMIKQVQISVVGRQMTPDQGFSERYTSGVNTSGPVIMSDHNPSADTGYDASAYSKLRRRVVTRVIQPRNM
ncbi:MAG: PilW family protein [Nitrospira sp.]|nr:PilW family protein [Nitrospira sp.]